VATGTDNMANESEEGKTQMAIGEEPMPDESVPTQLSMQTGKSIFRNENVKLIPKEKGKNENAEKRIIWNLQNDDCQAEEGDECAIKKFDGMKEPGNAKDEISAPVKLKVLGSGRKARRKPEETTTTDSSDGSDLLTMDVGAGKNSAIT